MSRTSRERVAELSRGVAEVSRGVARCREVSRGVVRCREVPLNTMACSELAWRVLNSMNCYEISRGWHDRMRHVMVP